MEARKAFPDKHLVLAVCFVDSGHPLAALAPHVTEPVIVDFLADWGLADAAMYNVNPDEQPWCRTATRTVCIIGPRN